jgi:hypothetical protein
VSERPHSDSSAPKRDALNVTDLGTAFGLDVKERQTELHVFNGSVEFQSTNGAAK